MIYVDNLLPSNGPIFTKNDSCRLVAEDRQELEKIATQLNLSHFYKVDNYYYLTRKKREAAIKLGACQITNKEMDVLLDDSISIKKHYHHTIGSYKTKKNIDIILDKRIDGWYYKFSLFNLTIDNGNFVGYEGALEDAKYMIDILFKYYFR